MIRQAIWNFLNDALSNSFLHPQYFIKFAEQECLKVVENHAKGVFLDIGCGRQWYRSRLEPLFDKYFALDNPITRKKYHSLYTVELKADVTHIPLEAKLVDVAMMNMVLEHLPDPEKALLEIRRVLGRGCILVVCTVENYPGHDFPYNYYHFTSFGLKEIFKRSGFKIVKLQSFGNFWETQVVMQNVYLMHFVKRLTDRKNTFALGVLILLFLMLLMILGNIFGLLLGRRKVTEEFALAHIVVASVKT